MQDEQEGLSRQSLLNHRKIGQGDQLEPPISSSINACWDMASKLFKSPLKAPAIPLPDNLLTHIEKKFPKYVHITFLNEIF